MLEALFDLFSAWGPSGRKRTEWADNVMDAYERAWNARIGSSGGADLLVSELKAANVPGAYTQPEHRADLALWFESWAVNTTPENLRQELRDRAAQQH